MIEKSKYRKPLYKKIFKTRKNLGNELKFFFLKKKKWEKFIFFAKKKN